LKALTTNHLKSAGRLGLATALATIAVCGPAAAWELRVCADGFYEPFSNIELEGLDNKIAAIIAEDMGADLTFHWWPQTPSMISEHLREGTCDLIMGSPDSHQAMLPTIAYYQSPYVFVYRADSPFDIDDYDDPDLASLRLGVQATGDPPHNAVSKRGLKDNVVLQYSARRDDERGPLVHLIDALAEGEIDVAMPWGPVGGFWGRRASVEMKVVEAPAFDFPFTPMYISVVMATRRGDESLRDQIDIAIANRWEEIQAVLEEFDVPMLPLARPILTLEGNR